MIEQANTNDMWDDSTRDFRQRYYLPEQFIWHIDDWARIVFDGYMRVVMGSLPKPPAHVLDVGCGPGLGAKVMSEHGYKVVGIDYNERGIYFARLLVPEVEFLLGDVRQLEEMTHLHNQFDAATHVEVIEHIPPDFHAKVLQGIRCMLQPYGALVLTVPSLQIQLNKWHYKHFDLDEIVHLLNENGFKVTDTVYQYRVSLLFSRQVWRLIANKYYDIRFARRILRQIFLRWFNTTNDANKAGRFIIRARRAE